MLTRFCVLFTTLGFIVSLPVLPAEKATSNTASPKANTSTPESASARAKPATQKKPAVTRTAETQLSGFTSQDADHIYARLAVQEKKGSHDWFIRASYSQTATKDGSKSHVNTMKVDSRYERRKSNDRYDVWTGVVSRLDRQTGRRQPRRSGYHLLSYGFGKMISPRFKGDLGLGLMEDYDVSGGSKPVLVGTLRGRHPLNPKLDLESEVLVLQPVETFRSTKVDSDIALVHQFAPGLSLRLGWSVNNLIRPVRGSHEWDSVLRLVIAYRHTRTR